MTSDRKLGGRVVPLKRAKGKCPICGKPADVPNRPFCSKRCADVDLGRWLGEVYRVPVEGSADSSNLDTSDDDLA
ncbi:MAG: DNA gyrase inhibitor YacG [Kiloniellales bacterium]|nr:DNA gyrase inhibitor YacG [Kiloniellales bacterium]